MSIPIAPVPSELPQGDPAGQAVASLRGYAYQLYASALAWLTLRDDEVLYLEIAQDYAIAARDALAAVQVKDTQASVTIVSEGARQAIDDFVDLVERNPGRPVSLRFLSTAGIGKERERKHRVGAEPTLEYWAKVANGADVVPLRTILDTIVLSDKSRAFIAARNDEQLRDDLIRRISWDCGALSLDDTRHALEDQLVLYGAKHLKVPANEAKQKSANILQHLLAKAADADAGMRKLTIAELLSLLDTASRISLPRADVDVLIKHGADAARNMAQVVPAPLGDTPQAAIAREALERDFAARYRRALKRSFFYENTIDLFQLLAREILDGQLTILSQELRRRIFLRAARSAAIRNEPANAERYFNAASQLKGPDSDLPARARIAERRGDLDQAIQILRDVTDSEIARRPIHRAHSRQGR